MSNILKGILNESNPFYGHNDPAKEYGAEDPSYPKRGRHSQTDDDEYDPYGLIRQEKDFAKGRAMKAAEKAQRDSDHDRLATGTNEGMSDSQEYNTVQPRMKMNDYYDLADDIQEKLRHAIKIGDKERIRELDKQRNDLDARVKQYGLVPESQLDELSNEKLTQYKTAASSDASKADSEGDYKRGDKRFSGIVKATKKQFKNDIDQHYDDIKKKSAISQGINELAIGPTGPKGPKDYGQPNSSRYIGKDKFVVGTTNNYVLTATVDKWGLEWDEDDEIWFLDSPGAAHIADASEGEIELPPPREQRNQIHDLVTDYLNARNSADLQKVAAYYGHSDDGEMATNESSEAPRFNSKQEVINHFVKNGKSAASGAAAWERGYRGSSKKPIELKKPPQRSYHDDVDDKRYSNTFENLGDQLTSSSLNALVQAKLDIEKKREADMEAWRQDFEKNTVQKAQQGLSREFQPTPVAQPGEKYSVLKARLVQLNNAIQKQELLDKIVNRLERKGLMTPAMQNDADTRMHVRYGAKDNYESLNKKLDNAIKILQSRLNIRKISGLKEVHDERDEYDNPKQGRDYGKGNLFVDPGSTEFSKERHPSDPDVERGRPKKLKGISKALPADAFGRTTGKIPRGKTGTVHSKMSNTDEVDEEKQRLDPKCWTGYKKQGTKMKGGVRVNNCVPVKETNSSILEGIQQVDEINWKHAAAAGAMALGALGSGGAHAGGVSLDSGKGFQPQDQITMNQQSQQTANDNNKSAASGLSTEYLQQAAKNVSGRIRMMVSSADAIKELQARENGAQQTVAPTQTPSPSTATIPGQGLVRAERADRQAGTVTVDGQEYKMIMLEPGGIRPRGGQQIVIPQAVMGERGIGNYMAILAGGRVFVLPRNE